MNRTKSEFIEELSCLAALLREEGNSDVPDKNKAPMLADSLAVIVSYLRTHEYPQVA